MKKRVYNTPEVKLVSFEPDGKIMVDYGDGAGVGDGDVIGNEASTSSTDTGVSFDKTDWFE